jgi:molecular chaperone GrpE
MTQKETTSDNTEETPIDTPSTESEQQMKNEMEDCLSKIRELEDQLAQSRDQAIRAVAEAENTRNRTSKELEESRKYAVSGIVRDLVPVLENLYRSTEHLSDEDLQNDSINKVFVGITLIQDEFINILGKYGATRITPQIGDKFDHNYHQALSRVKDETKPENSIVMVIQSGYALHGRLIKPAMVVVSSKD